MLCLKQQIQLSHSNWGPLSSHCFRYLLSFITLQSKLLLDKNIHPKQYVTKTPVRYQVQRQRYAIFVSTFVANIRNYYIPALFLYLAILNSSAARQVFSLRSLTGLKSLIPASVKLYCHDVKEFLIVHFFASLCFLCVFEIQHDLRYFRRT